MRMRKKPNLVPRMERCAATMITEPEALRGRWLEQFPGHQALQLELGCGKGRFTADTAAQNPDIFLAAIEKVPDAMVVGMERVTERGIENVRFLDRDAINLLDMFAPGEVSRHLHQLPRPVEKIAPVQAPPDLCGLSGTVCKCAAARRRDLVQDRQRPAVRLLSRAVRAGGLAAARRSRTTCTPTARSAS